VKEPCPICGEECSSVEDHVWEEHCRPHFEMSSRLCGMCWCNDWIGYHPCHSDMMRHMDLHGGLQAHWLEHHLGVVEPNDLPF
jgi:hypothetical protein